MYHFDKDAFQETANRHRMLAQGAGTVLVLIEPVSKHISLGLAEPYKGKEIYDLVFIVDGSGPIPIDTYGCLCLAMIMFYSMVELARGVL